MKGALAAPLLAAALAAAPAAAQSGDEWRFTVAPYLWLPTIDTTLKFRTPNGNPEVNIKADPDDYLSDLDMALLLAFEARKGKWLVATDVTYMKLSTDGGAVRAVDFTGPGGRIPVSAGLDAGTETEIESHDLDAGGRLQPRAGPHVVARCLSAGRATSSWRGPSTGGSPRACPDLGGGGATFPASGSATQKGDNWDVIVGVKGRAKLGEGNWFVPFILDAGTGDSKYTLQAQTGIGYAFRWGDLVLAYRYLGWKRDDDTKPIQELELYGFGLGGIFRF